MEINDTKETGNGAVIKGVKPKNHTQVSEMPLLLKMAFWIYEAQFAGFMNLH